MADRSAARLARGASSLGRGNGNGRVAIAPEGELSGDGRVGELRRAVTRLELANDALQRENARLARALHGQSGSAAAVRLTRAERRWRDRAEEAELRAERLARLLGTPRHRAVESARDRLMRLPLLYAVVRRVWRG